MAWDRRNAAEVNRNGCLWCMQYLDEACGAPAYVVNDDSRGDRVHPAPRLSSCRLRVDRRHVRLLAIRDLYDDCGLDGVPVCVELVGAADAREGRILHGIPDVRALD